MVDDVKKVEKKKVVCDGNQESGHPRVFLNMGEKDEIECPYCGKKFVLNKKAA